MHSIFGTEINNLPPGLEQYYKRYFTDRLTVVGFANKYQAEFSSRETVVNQTDARLAVLKTQIDDAQANLKTRQSAISAERKNLEELRESGDVNAYNTGVPIYNNMVEGFNNQVEKIRSLIDQYNQLVAKRNAVASEEDALVDALNSNVETIQQ